MISSSKSEIYSAFAEIYDDVMRDVDYKSWAQYVFHLCERFGVRLEKALDLACGTGALTLRLAESGLETFGVDRSPAMLNRARDKAEAAEVEVEWGVASMESFSQLKLPRDFDLITCLYDSLNYIMNEEDVARCVSEAYDHLRPGGAFVFDVTTEYNLLHNFSGYTFAENFEYASYIWENDYNIEQKICSSRVTIFMSKRDGYAKHVEVHLQRVYSTSALRRMLKEIGFEVLGTFHNITELPVQPKSERIHFFAGNPG